MKKALLMSMIGEAVVALFCVVMLILPKGDVQTTCGLDEGDVVDDDVNIERTAVPPKVYNLIYEHNLFHPDRNFTNDMLVDPNAAAQASNRKIEITLMAILQIDNKSVAQIQVVDRAQVFVRGHGKDVQVYKPGDTISQTDFVLETVTHQGARIKKNGKQVTLTLNSPFKVK